ncbi:MAG: hypothetical protein HYY84_12100 [Deltaproteobacteria bacterium]|nr:hypothetical protein [Deltaproteobacteria bacterium]
MRAIATFVVERSDAWGMMPWSSSRVGEAVRGALREALVAHADGVCVRPGACDAKSTCAACELFGAAGRPGRVSVAATFNADSGAVSVEVGGGNEDVTRVNGLAKAVRRFSLNGQTWRVRDVRFGEAGAGAEAGAEAEADAGAVAVRLEALSPWLVASFSWGDRFRAGASPCVPGSQLRGALGVEGGRVSHLRLLGDARARFALGRGHAGAFAEEAWEAGAIFEARVDGGRFTAVNEGAIGAGRNRGYGRFRATYRPLDNGIDPIADFNKEPSNVTIAFETDAALPSRADLTRALFGEGAATLHGALIARGPTGAPITWVRGRPAIPAGSRFEFALIAGERERAAETLRVALKTGVGDGAADGYGELRVLEMKQ